MIWFKMNAYVFLILYVLFIWGITKGGIVWCTVKNAKRKKYNIFIVMSFFAFFLLSALRDETVGVDTVNYVKFYEIARTLKWRGLLNGEWDHKFYTTEKGYMIFEKICQDLEIPTQVFIALCAGIFIYGVYKLVANYTKNSALLAAFSFLAVGSYLLAMNALRQGIGVGLCCLAWCRLKRGDWKGFIVEVLIATSFHVSCCIFLLAFLLEKIPSSKKSVLILAIGLIIFGFVGATVLPFVLRWFPVYAMRYGNGRWKINEANGIVAVWIIVIAIVLGLAIKRDWKEEKYHADFEIMIFSMCYVSINIIGLSFDGAQRLSMLFQPFLILLFDRSCDLWHGETKSVYSVGVLIGMLALFIRASSTAQYVYLPFWG